MKKDPVKLEALKLLPFPKNVKEVRSNLDFTGTIAVS